MTMGLASPIATKLLLTHRSTTVNREVPLNLMKLSKKIGLPSKTFTNAIR